MSYKNWRNTEMNSLLLEKWGYQKGSMAETAEEEPMIESEAGCPKGWVLQDGECVDPTEMNEALNEEEDEIVEESVELNETRIRETIRRTITKALKNRKS